MTISSPAAVINPNGISAPTFADIFSWAQEQYRAIYGADVYLEPDSQDGQLLGVFAKALSDANSVAIDVYNSFSPSTAQGAALSNNVKINGIVRHGPSYSTADLTVVGQTDTTITNGIAKASNGSQWALPPSVTIPASGEIVVTATCTVLGAIPAPAGTINQIGTPSRGWQTVTNVSDAAVGAPIESDAALRLRQTYSTALPSQTVLDGIVGAVASLAGVTRCVPYENDTNLTDANGLPPHTISLVVEGGDVIAIADAILLKKTPGGGTYGTTNVTVINRYGRPVTVKFFRPTNAPITVTISLIALTGYTTATGQAIQQTVSDYINSVAIGGGGSGSVEWDACIAAAKSVSGSSTFKIASLTLTGPRGSGAPDVALLFNEAASCVPSSVTIIPS